MNNASTAPLATLRFQSTEFDVVDIHGQAWLRCPQIGDALGYAKEGRIAIDRLYKSNADEFTSDLTQVIELPTAGGRQQVRIFSLRGAHLLGMLARTEVAKAFRRWVLDVLDGLEVPQQIGTLSLNQRLQYLKVRLAMLRELKAVSGPNQLGFARELYAQLRQISRFLGLTPQPLEDLAPALRQQALPGTP